MFTDCPQYPAQIEELRPVQVECCDSRPARCSTAYDKHEVCAPYKVPRPTLPAWMKERSQTSCLWIWSMRPRVFECVTPRAGPREIV